MENQLDNKSTNVRLQNEIMVAEPESNGEDFNESIEAKFRISTVNDRLSYQAKIDSTRSKGRNFGLVGAHIFLSTKRVRPSRKEMDVINSSNQNYFLLDGKKIKFYQWGNEGKLIFLVHGWNGNVGNFSRFVPDLIAMGYRVVGIDLPGHGNSEGRYSNAVLASRAVFELSRIVGNPYAFITHSFGGAAATIAQELGLQADRLVYICPPRDLMSITLGFAGYWKLSEDEILQTRDAIESKVGRKLADLDLIRIGKMLNNKLLLIHDKDDSEIPYTFGEKVSQAWSQSKLLLTSGLGHRMILRDEGIKLKVLDFLENGFD
ncbi:alpha/beta hydrolase [Leptospira sp. GIMC2001]|uniref:alpha/beta hydrolase n=1 Tax=Leptospira sp. GIMC2001 TaxID=1513297 RepID=UPI00234BE161|nr:alpha/beta hydrolase [Leptospira sp. GIMC2001]WCL50529.1 alpha/beta hydrolase [Leptospira sp. GIMC2001]